MKTLELTDKQLDLVQDLLERERHVLKNWIKDDIKAAAKRYGMEESIVISVQNTVEELAELLTSLKTQ